MYLLLPDRKAKRQSLPRPVKKARRAKKHFFPDYSLLEVMIGKVHLSIILSALFCAVMIVSTYPIVHREDGKHCSLWPYGNNLQKMIFIVTLKPFSRRLIIVFLMSSRRRFQKL